MTKMVRSGTHVETLIAENTPSNKWTISFGSGSDNLCRRFMFRLQCDLAKGNSHCADRGRNEGDLSSTAIRRLIDVILSIDYVIKKGPD